MLAGLAIDRVRRLLEDAVGTLEQGRPTDRYPSRRGAPPGERYRQVPSGACLHSMPRSLRSAGVAWPAHLRWPVLLGAQTSQPPASDALARRCPVAALVAPSARPQPAEPTPPVRRPVGRLASDPGPKACSGGFTRP